ncbi:MAG: exodeoxyribonuclease VII large subunit, partial [Pseudomonadales bacterium]|nr:exodeoxyribonuclease VII large subunit [Pseudomonadales bacterium]
MRVSSETDSPVLSVSELNQFARGALEMHVGKVWVSGEISNFSAPASGHWYFTLKDDNAQISCAMFRGKNQFIRTRLKPGMQILVNGKVSLYEGRGSYQLIADYLEESGVGAMARAVEALKAKLLQEGLFEQSRKKPLPRVLQHIAVITSDTGAAIHDIISVLAERFPQLNITLIAAQVQGDAAPVSLKTALDRANRYHAEVPIDA